MRLAVLMLLLTACSSDVERTARQLTGGEPERGRVAIAQYGCGACHEVPGVDNASGRVGPPLNNIGDRTTLAGRLPNTATNMMRWVREPQSVEPGSAMPDMNVSQQDARDIAAYLYTLRQ